MSLTGGGKPRKYKLNEKQTADLFYCFLTHRIFYLLARPRHYRRRNRHIRTRECLLAPALKSLMKLYKPQSIEKGVTLVSRYTNNNPLKNIRFLEGVIKYIGSQKTENN
jgi:hypothetical protein